MNTTATEPVQGNQVRQNARLFRSGPDITGLPQGQLARQRWRSAGRILAWLRQQRM